MPLKSALCPYRRFSFLVNSPYFQFHVKSLEIPISHPIFSSISMELGGTANWDVERKIEAEDICIRSKLQIVDMDILG